MNVVLDQHGALGAMAEGHQVVDRVERHLFPFPSLFVLDIPGAGAVEVGLANVVEQSDDDEAFIADLDDGMPSDYVKPHLGAVLIDLIFVKQSPESVQHIEAVLQEAALAGEVELRAGRGRVEVALADVVHQLVNAGALYPGHFCFKTGNQFCFVFHILSPLICGGKAALWYSPLASIQ